MADKQPPAPKPDASKILGAGAGKVDLENESEFNLDQNEKPAGKAFGPPKKRNVVFGARKQQQQSNFIFTKPHNTATLLVKDEKQTKQAERNQFFADNFGDVNAIDDGSTWSTETAARAKQLGAEPWMQYLKDTSVHQQKRQQGVILRQEPIWGQTKNGKIQIRSDPLEVLFSRHLDTSEIVSLSKTSQFEKAKKFLANFQKNITLSRDYSPAFVNGLIQLLCESFEIENQVGKITVMLGVLKQDLLSENVNEDITNNLQGILQNLTLMNETSKHHQNLLVGLKQARENKKQSGVWNKVNSIIKKRAAEYRLLAEDFETQQPYYDGLVFDLNEQQAQIDRKKESWKKSQADQRAKNAWLNPSIRGGRGRNRYRNRYSRGSFNRDYSPYRGRGNVPHRGRGPGIPFRGRGRGRPRTHVPSQTRVFSEQQGWIPAEQYINPQQPPTNRTLKCHHCGTPGHIRPNCPFKHLPQAKALQAAKKQAKPQVFQ